MNRRSLLAVVVGVSGLAGCQSTSDCPPLLHVNERNESEVAAAEQDVISYQQLSEKRKQEFTRSLENGSTELGETSEAWVSTYFVQYRGRYYATTVAVC